MARSTRAVPWIIAAAAVACLVLMAVRLERLREQVRELESRATPGTGTAAAGAGGESAELARLKEEVERLRRQAGGGASDAEARRREEEARRREERRWVEGLKAKARAWLDREASRLSMAAGQVDEGWRVVEALAEQLDGIRRGSGERDVERLIHDVYEEGDGEFGAVLTAGQREKFGGMPRAWADEITAGMTPK